MHSNAKLALLWSVNHLGPRQNVSSKSFNESCIFCYTRLEGRMHTCLAGFVPSSTSPLRCDLQMASSLLSRGHLIWHQTLYCRLQRDRAWHFIFLVHSQEIPPATRPTDWKTVSAGTYIPREDISFHFWFWPSFPLVHTSLSFSYLFFLFKRMEVLFNDGWHTASITCKSLTSGIRAGIS